MKDELRRTMLDPSHYKIEISKERTLSILGAADSTALQSGLAGGDARLDGLIRHIAGVAGRIASRTTSRLGG